MIHPEPTDLGRRVVYSDESGQYPGKITRMVGALVWVSCDDDRREMLTDCEDLRWEKP